MQRALAWLLGMAVIAAAWWFAGHPGWQSPEQKLQREQMAKGAETTKLYRWQDQNGVTQITQTPPKGRKYKTIEMRNDQNVMESNAPAPEPPQ